MNPDILTAKQILRREMASVRESIRPLQAEQWSRQIVSLLMASPLIPASADPTSPCSVGLYVAMRQEADLSLAWQNLRERGCKLCFPRMTTTDGQTDLEFMAIPEQCDPQDFLVTSRFGVREPAACLPITANGSGLPAMTSCDPEIILLPGLAFDRYGHRLGWGKGYYDHYLTRRAQTGRSNPICVGVAYPFQLIEQVPATEQDIPVDYLLSPDGIFKTR